MRTNTVVAKFGGSSLADAKAVERAVEIVRADPARRLIVVSAPGRRQETDGDPKVTDLLFRLHAVVMADGHWKPLWGEIKARFIEIVAGLKLEIDIQKEFDQIEEFIKTRARLAYFASRGEYLMAKIMAAALGAEFVDAGDVIWFDEGGEIDMRRSRDALRAACVGQENRWVIPGYYGCQFNNGLRLFSRGGSDITGAIVAAAMDAAVYENWTDVDGVLMTDPRVVPGARSIKEMTYREMRELAYMGATVLHEAAVFPVIDASVPIHIRNTFSPESPGTRIVSDRLGQAKVIGIAGRRPTTDDQFAVVVVEKAQMNTAVGFANKVLAVIERMQIPFEHMPGGIDTLSIVAETRHLREGRLQELLRGINEAVAPDRLKVHDNLALIAVVGMGAMQKNRTLGRLFGALSEGGVAESRMITLGASNLSIIIGVDCDCYESAVRALYGAFTVE